MKDFLPSAAQARALLAPVAPGEVDDERARRLYATHTWSCHAEPGDGVAGRLVGALGRERAPWERRFLHGLAPFAAGVGMTLP